MQRLLNEKEVAEQIGMSVHWMRHKRLTGGGIPFLKMGDGAKGGVRYEQGAVDTFKAGRVRRSTSDQA
jgi:hypothetical protein